MSIPTALKLSRTYAVLSDEQTEHLRRQLALETQEVREWISARAQAYFAAAKTWAPRECESAAHLDYELHRLRRTLEDGSGQPADKATLTRAYFKLMGFVTEADAYHQKEKFT